MDIPVAIRAGLRADLAGESDPPKAFKMTNERVEMAVHAAIARALDEAGVKIEVLRGMCIEVGLEKFQDEMRASEPQAESISHAPVHVTATGVVERSVRDVLGLSAPPARVGLPTITEQIIQCGMGRISLIEFRAGEWRWTDDAKAFAALLAQPPAPPAGRYHQNCNTCTCSDPDAAPGPVQRSVELHGIGCLKHQNASLSCTCPGGPTYAPPYTPEQPQSGEAARTVEVDSDALLRIADHLEWSGKAESAQKIRDAVAYIGRALRAPSVEAAQGK